MLDDSALHPAPLQQLRRLAHPDDGGQQPPVYMGGSSHAATCAGGNREDQAGATGPHVTDAGLPISRFSASSPILPGLQKPQMKLRLMDWGLPPGIVEVMQELHASHSGVDAAHFCILSRNSLWHVVNQSLLTCLSFRRSEDTLVGDQAYRKKGVEKMYRWQAAALEEGVNGNNLVYCAPTSGGKSLIAEVLMIRRLLSFREPGRPRHGVLVSMLLVCMSQSCLLDTSTLWVL
jgi:hypothetical protein